MISVVYTHGEKRVRVIYRHSYSYKKDSLGRRIRGSARTGELLGYTVQCDGIPDQEFPPTMTAREAAKKFTGRLTELAKVPAC